MSPSIDCMKSKHMDTRSQQLKTYLARMPESWCTCMDEFRQELLAEAQPFYNHFVLIDWLTEVSNLAAGPDEALCI